MGKMGVGMVEENKGEKKVGGWKKVGYGEGFGDWFGSGYCGCGLFEGRPGVTFGELWLWCSVGAVEISFCSSYVKAK